MSSPWITLATVEAWTADLPPGVLEHAWIVGAVYLVIIVAGLCADVALLFALARRPPWPSYSSRILVRAWPWADVARLVAILVSTLLLLLSARDILAALGFEALADRDRLWLVVQSLGFHWLGLLLIALALKKRGATWDKAMGLRLRGLGRRAVLGLVCYLAAMPVILVYSAIYQAVLIWSGYDTTLQNVVLALTGEQPFWMQIYLLFLGVALAPLVEELLFRGVLLPFLARKFGLGMGILLVSFLFAGVHFHVPSLVALFLLSVALSLSYVQTGSILVPAVFHAVFNAVNLALMLILRSG